MDAERLKRGLDVVQLERLDDSRDELHLVSLRSPVPTIRYRRFTGPVGVCRPRETRGVSVTSMFQARRPECSAEDGVHEDIRIERGQVVRPLAEADELD